MNKRTFLEYIAESDFRGLFIREMGWNNPSGQTQFDFTVDDCDYSYTLVAERNGFQVLSCEIESVPTSSLCKKIDTKLRRQANDYICIYYNPGSQHHLWVVPVKKVEKRDLVLVEYETATQADFLFEKVDGFSFDLDEKTTIMDVKERVQDAFIVNSEKITKDFYTGFRKEHANFAKFISGIDDEIDVKENRNKQWYTSVMLNRLMFCYFIQKKGFLDFNKNYLREKLQQIKSQKGDNKFYSFYRRFLISLFHDGLNSPRHESDFEKMYGRIPYLNGGMFDVHELEAKYPDIDIDNQAFESLFSFFDQWHWHLDDRLTASGKDINPDVLGYIFEQYINDRAQMGAYYTKEDITEYIGRNTIVPYLLDETRRKDETPFRANGAIWQFLRDSGNRYIYDAVKKGHNIALPDYIQQGVDTTSSNLLERRARWNESTPEPWALPTEIWRETVERLQRYQSIQSKIERGEICQVNDFITYNLDIRQFVLDFLTKTEDHLFVLHFYHALQQITILDPTCGSGAFLFAALNILEPLYEACISRMQEWQQANPNLFKSELEELNVKYRSNIRYFIYKSIILRNLYGVDIMVEATEIAKLRLFLKMAAVVEINPRDPNLGLEPLPDVDFNIRCGNSLVGYATEKDLEDGVLAGADLFAWQEYHEVIKDEMQKVAKAYETFKFVQLKQTTDLEVYKYAKKELNARLKDLNNLLNKTLHSATAPCLDYDTWLKTHQPFHWIAEYYGIVKGNGGFDVVIGNPPYVEYADDSFSYSLSHLKTAKCGNLYGNCIERSLDIGLKDGKFSFIVPVAITCSKRMKPVIQMLKEKSEVLMMSNYDDRPGKLFEMIEHLRATIIISSKTTQKSSKFVYATKYNRWYSENRRMLFNLVNYVDVTKFVGDYLIPKYSFAIECSIEEKIHSFKTMIASNCDKVSRGNEVYYRAAGGGYFLLMKIQKSVTYIDGQLEDVKAEKQINVSNHAYNSCIGGLLSSSLFYWNYIGNTDCRNLSKSFIDTFPMPNEIACDKELSNVSISLFDNYEITKRTKNTTYKSTGRNVIYDEYYPKLSKTIIDEIDKVIAKHYGFTDEELDFIINFDIKYRMGCGLNEE
ncbi:MAG: Eco57I restriction-modification methylase domain-containing protein [Bacteroidales bacterium]|nr:Eco57I restriction-modification methylase domain-containing protein [Bacteroidales bacterium]